MTSTTLAPDLQAKLDHLRAIIRACGSALVAYSGGIDSTLVLAVAHEQLGDKALACIGVSPSYPRRELEEAIAIAREIGAAYRLVETNEHLNPNYAANPVNRCYFCKSTLHSHLVAIAREEGWNAILDGANASDVGDFRPGMQAAREKGVRSPLLEANITKPEVRAIARALGLRIWDKPAMACLSSRVPHGTPITPDLLRQIEAAEDTLVALGFRQFRVRHHGDIARIELAPDELLRAIEQREAIVAGVRAAGYRFVTLDLAGYQRGSMNAIHVARDDIRARKPVS